MLVVRSGLLRDEGRGYMVGSTEKVMGSGYYP